MTPRTEAGRRLLALLGDHAPWFVDGSREREVGVILAIEAEATGAALAALRDEVRWLNPMMRGDEAVQAVAWLRAEILAAIDRLSGAAPAAGEE